MRKIKEGVYYDYIHDHLVILYVIGCRFHVFADFKDVTMKAVSKKNGCPMNAGLIFIGDE